MFSEEGLCGTCFGYECPTHGCRCCPNGHPEDPEFYRARRLCGACYGRNVPYEDSDAVPHPDSTLIAAAPELLAELERLEWVICASDLSISECPSCLGVEETGHRKDCTLNAAIKKARGTA